jgi:hypothetical protein
MPRETAPRSRSFEVLSSNRLCLKMRLFCDAGACHVSLIMLQTLLCSNSPSRTCYKAEERRDATERFVSRSFLLAATHVDMIATSF